MKKPVKTASNLPMKPTETDLIIYQAEDGSTKVDVRVYHETVWLSLNQLASLFQRDKSVISKHIRNILDEGELEEGATVAFFATVQTEGNREISRNIEYYNLDMILAIGYRVNSHRGTQFRQWATQRLSEYIVKGFALDDERLMETGGGSYFPQLLARIRAIRASEKMFWKKVLEIYATSVDYSPTTDLSRQFFAVVQNKMHWAAHGHTAAEVIATRADATLPQMGLTSLKKGKPTLEEATIAKNYLNEQELDALNRIVTIYLDFAELQALNQRLMYMRDWIAKLDEFLKISERPLLNHPGSVSHEAALAKARVEYEKYRALHADEPSQVERDFEQVTKQLEAKNKVRSKKK